MRIAIATLTLLAASVVPAAVVNGQLALPIPGGSAEKACVTRPQLEALITYALPSIIEQVSRICAPSLKPDAFLRTSSSQLAAHYRADSERHWPVARSAVASLAGQDISGLGEQTEKAMVTSMVGIGIASAIKSKDCGDVDEVVELLSPLPAANLGRLTAMLAIIGSRDGEPGDSPFSICPAAGDE